MNKDELSNILKRLVVEKLKLDIAPSELEMEDSLLELGLGLDSVSTLEFILLLEEQFGVEIDEGNISLDNLSDIKSLTEYIVDLV